jgi:tRNA(fMet)-specific endonuclease VapC
VIELMRPGVPNPPAFHEARAILLPLPVLGELLAGVYSSRQSAANRRILEGTIETWNLLAPDLETAHHYGRLRGALRIDRLGSAKRNDLWIAALCLQHDLPLLTNDRGFDAIENLRVLHW